MRERLEQVLGGLAVREREVLKLRFGIGSRKAFTLDELGRMFNVTRERTRQIEIRAIRKLQDPRRALPLESFLEQLP